MHGSASLRLFNQTVNGESNKLTVSRHACLVVVSVNGRDKGAHANKSKGFLKEKKASTMEINIVVLFQS